MQSHTRYRFFPFQVMAPCSEDAKSCVGGKCGDDDSKIMCGVDLLRSEQDCIIYAIGGDNQWDFEMDLLEKTPCQIHTFDCTGDRSRFHVPAGDIKNGQKSQNYSGRLHFHHICLSDAYRPVNSNFFDPITGKCIGKSMCGEALTLKQMQQQLNHTRIDL